VGRDVQSTLRAVLAGRGKTGLNKERHRRQDAASGG
jgi:hypothetical protein